MVRGPRCPTNGGPVQGRNWERARPTATDSLIHSHLLGGPASVQPQPGLSLSPQSQPRAKRYACSNSERSNFLDNGDRAYCTRQTNAVRRTCQGIHTNTQNRDHRTAAPRRRKRKREDARGRGRKDALEKAQGRKDTGHREALWTPILRRLEGALMASPDTQRALPTLVLHFPHLGDHLCGLVLVDFLVLCLSLGWSSLCASGAVQCMSSRPASYMYMYEYSTLPRHTHCY